MRKKPVSPALHGINDYLFSGVLLFAPSLFGFNNKTQKLYASLSSGLFKYNAFTQHPVAIKQIIPYSTHYKLDCANVALLALLSFYKPVRENKSVLAFHLAYTALTAVNILLTDWKANSALPKQAI